ncbi:MAG: T9SS type A sorting domain-containing protein [Flavobacteriales bacterium]|nr:T9SS type A sorting domain-containing protein [Flavobacteriales bacterium]
MNTYVLQLNAWLTNPLICGTVEYNVRVQASFDGGATYCPYGTPCTVEITNDAPNPCTGGSFVGGTLNAAPVSSTNFSLYPNPSLDGRVTLELMALSTEVKRVSIDIFDLFGRKVMAQVIATGGADQLSTVLLLPTDLATGVYMVTVVAGTTTYTERLVVE